MRTEIQAFDSDYKALMTGGIICLSGAAVTIIVHLSATHIKISTDGSGIALLLLLFGGSWLISRSIDGRNRVRANDGFLPASEHRFHTPR